VPGHSFLDFGIQFDVAGERADSGFHLRNTRRPDPRGPFSCRSEPKDAASDFPLMARKPGNSVCSFPEGEKVFRWAVGNKVPVPHGTPTGKRKS
jgi:hypothetical protein